MNKFIILLFLYLVSTIILILSFSAFGIISVENCLDITLFSLIFNSILMLLIIAIVKTLKLKDEDEI